jgi:hypothetical protein
VAELIDQNRMILSRMAQVAEENGKDVSSWKEVLGK